MKQTYRRLLRLYPPHIRAIYGDEMRAGFDAGCDQCSSRLSLIRFCSMSMLSLAIDATVERLWTFGSHPSFSGRRPPDFGMVRPPNMGKKEWFHRGHD